MKSVLGHYTILLKNYRRLRSDHEGEKESRENYKSLSRGPVHNSFVLVLIDGDEYLFNDDFTKIGVEGGSNAAQALHTSIKNSYAESEDDLDQCRVMARVYANLVELSKASARNKLAGPHQRSLAPFATGFTHAQDLFDFIDTTDEEAGAASKIRGRCLLLDHHLCETDSPLGMFQLFIDSSQCRHLFFGACHDAQYLSLLRAYRGMTDRITLLRNHRFCSEFSSLGFRIIELPSVFRASPFSITLLTAYNEYHTRLRSPPTSVTPCGNGGHSIEKAHVCRFFQAVGTSPRL